MRVLHVLKEAPSDSVRLIIEAHRKVHQVEVIRLDLEGVEYDRVISSIETCDRVMVW